MEQEIAAKENRIALISVESLTKKECTEQLLPGEISGAEVFYHSLPEQTRHFMEHIPNMLRTLLLIDGELEIKSEERCDFLAERGSYVAAPESAPELFARQWSHVLEI